MELNWRRVILRSTDLVELEKEEQISEDMSSSKPKKLRGLKIELNWK
jgi:hypothetical protein